MAKKKKSNRKKNKRKNVGKNTTIQPALAQASNHTANNKIEDKTIEAIPSQHQDEISDVRYSLVLFGAFLVFFAVLYFVLKNQSISAALYGIIKL